MRTRYSPALKAGKYLWLLLFFASPLVAQVTQSGVRYVTTAPSGACAQSPPIQIVISTGDTWGCVSGTWTKIGSGGGATLPTATLAGQVLTATGPGTAYTAQTPSSPRIANLPGSPNVAYNFIQPNDQGTSLTITDLTGNGNNAAITVPSGHAGNLWTGTGINFTCFGCGGSSTAQATLAAGTTPDLTWCFTAFNPAYDGVNPPNGNAQFNATYIANSGANSVFFAQAHDFGSGYGIESYYPWVSSGGGSSVTWTSGIPRAGIHTGCVIYGLASNSTLDRVFMDGVELNYAGHNSNTGTNLSGSNVLGPVQSTNSDLTFYYAAGWPTQLTAAQIALASYSMLQAVAAKTPIVNPPAVNPTTKYIAVGDSITCCGGSSTTQWYPSLVSINAAYTSVNNEGLGGFSAWAMNSFAPWKDAPQCATAGSRSMATIFAGTNDLFVYGFSAAQTMASIQGWVNTLTAAGCNVGVATMISRASSTGDAEKNALNPLIRSGAAAGGYFVIDTASNPNLGADGAYANTTYFNADATHPTNTGQTLLAAEYSNAINAYGIGAASASNPTVYTGNTVSMLSADRFAVANDAVATAWTLPDCLGVTGTNYQITNVGAGLVTFSGKASEAITGSATLAQNLVAIFQAQLISQAAAGCGWTRVQ